MHVVLKLIVKIRDCSVPAQKSPDCISEVAQTDFHTQFQSLRFLYGISRSGSGTTPAGPVSMEELATRLIDPLVCVGAEIIPLGL